MSSSFEMINTLEKFQIPLEDINSATGHFDEKNRIGGGGFGVVYKGELSERWGNRIAAVKCLKENSTQQKEDFEKELEMVSKFHHENIIPFIGYCNEGDTMIMVFKYASNGSLDRHLQDTNRRKSLTWVQRLKICLGAARGLKYLHSGLGDEHKVIHRDVKSANILIDDNMEAKICDFGLSRSAPRNQQYSEVHTRLAGTNVYCDPFYRESEILTKEADVYSFGLVLFEMLSGLLAYGTRRIGSDRPLTLIHLVRKYRDDGQENIIDSYIIDQIYIHSLETFKRVAYKCISYELKERPTMDRIVKEIEKALEFQENENIYPQDYKDLDYDEFRYMHPSPKLAGVESIWLFKVSGKKCYLLGARELSITWGHDPQYWEWGPIPESRFAEVGILKRVVWLEIRGKITTLMLSQNTTYAAYLVFRIAKDSKGLDVPTKTMVNFMGMENETLNVYVQKQEGTNSQENDRLPHERKDGWMEIELGEFYCDEEDDGYVEMVFDEVKSNKWKSGLIVEGIEVRPK